MLQRLGHCGGGLTSPAAGPIACWPQLWLWPLMDVFLLAPARSIILHSTRTSWLPGSSVWTVQRQDVGCTPFTLGLCWPETSPQAVVLQSAAGLKPPIGICCASQFLLLLCACTTHHGEPSWGSAAASAGPRLGRFPVLVRFCMAPPAGLPPSRGWLWRLRAQSMRAACPFCLVHAPAAWQAHVGSVPRSSRWPLQHPERDMTARFCVKGAGGAGSLESVALRGHLVVALLLESCFSVPAFRTAHVLLSRAHPRPLGHSKKGRFERPSPCSRVTWSTPHSCAWAVYEIHCFPVLQDFGWSLSPGRL